MEATIYKGQRWSAANAYLKPALKAGNVDAGARLCARAW